MRHRLASVTAGLIVLAAGCGGLGAGAGTLHTLAVPADAPYELADDQDLDALHERYQALPAGSAAREAERRRLAGEYARRVDRALERGERPAALQAFAGLLGLWTPTELADAAALAAAMAPYRVQARAVRETFARAGDDRGAATALAVLHAIDPAHAGDHEREMNDLFAFADDLAVAQYGDGAQRSRPIEILESVVEAFPSPYVVDLLVKLYLERQEAVDSHFKRHGADLQVIRAHGQGVLLTAWHVVRVHALAERLGESLAAIEAVAGIGDNADLRRRLTEALAPGAGAPAWVRLAEGFRGSEPESTDLRAAFRVCAEAATRFPRAGEAHLCAAKNAADLGSYEVAIRYSEAGLALAPARRDASERLGELYERQVTRLALADRPSAAREWLIRFERFHRSASSRGGAPLKPDLADAYAAMGRGLVSLGELGAARRYLDRSLELRPTLVALEVLGTIALKQDRFREAASRFERAIALEVDEIEAVFDRNRMLRLAGEAYEGAGDGKRAFQHYARALRQWSELRRRIQLSRIGMAEAELERGKVYWRLGQEQRALDSFERAIDFDPDGASTHADVVAFLIVRDQFRRALDAYHRALGSSDIGDYYKVYMSLWILAEARRRGEPEDPLALGFLADRDGRLWHDELARFASGRVALAPLTERATTRGRRAELLYYLAVLGAGERDPGEIRGLLERVLASDMVLFFEYDMAKHRLGR